MGESLLDAGAEPGAVCQSFGAGAQPSTPPFDLFLVLPAVDHEQICSL